MYYATNFNFFPHFFLQKLSGVPMSDTESAQALAAFRFFLAPHFAGQAPG
jgi:hypothetical protein